MPKQKNHPPKEIGPQPGNCPNDLDQPKGVEPLTSYQFDSVIRNIKQNATYATVQQIEAQLTEELRRLDVRRWGRAAVAGPPPVGSDHLDAQSLYAWAAKVQRSDEKAVKQLQAIWATAARRLG